MILSDFSESYLKSQLKQQSKTCVGVSLDLINKLLLILIIYFIMKVLNFICLQKCFKVIQEVLLQKILNIIHEKVIFFSFIY